MLHLFYCLEKQKLCLERTPPGKKMHFFSYVICGKQNRNQQTKLGGVFFYEVEGHMQKLSSSGQGKKKNGLKSHLL